MARLTFFLAYLLALTAAVPSTTHAQTLASPVYTSTSTSTPGVAVDVKTTELGTPPGNEIVTLQNPLTGDDFVAVFNSDLSLRRTVVLPTGFAGRGLSNVFAETGTSRDDLVVHGDQTFVRISDLDATSPNVRTFTLPVVTSNITDVAAAPSGNRSVVALSTEGDLSLSGGLVVQVDNSPPEFVSSTRPKFTRVALADLDDDDVVDIVAQGPGYVTVFRGVDNTTTLSFSQLFEITSPFGVFLTEALTLGDVNRDGHRDIVFVENDVFNSPPVVRLVTRLNSGSGTVGARFPPSLGSSRPLDGSTYVLEVEVVDRYDSAVQPLTQAQSSLFVRDGGVWRSTGRFDTTTLTFDALAHEIPGAPGSSPGASGRFDSNFTDDLVIGSGSSLVQLRSCHFPHADVVGTQGGSSVISSDHPLELGTTSTTRVTADQQGRLCVFMLALDGQNLELSTGVFLHVGSSIFCVKNVFTGSGNTADLSLGVPNNDTLLGRKLVIQAAVIKPGGAFAGVLDLTKAVVYVIGKTTATP